MFCARSRTARSVCAVCRGRCGRKTQVPSRPPLLQRPSPWMLSSSFQDVRLMNIAPASGPARPHGGTKPQTKGCAGGDGRTRILYRKDVMIAVAAGAAGSQRVLAGHRLAVKEAALFLFLSRLARAARDRRQVLVVGSSFFSSRCGIVQGNGGVNRGCESLTVHVD